MAIGIIGLGYVGRATAAVFARTHTVVGYDIKTGCWESFPESADFTETHMANVQAVDPMGRVAWATDVVFVCVPTPMKSDGSCDTSIVELVVAALEASCRGLEPKRIVAIKSTVPPGTTARLAERYHGIDLCFVPEFLRERTAVEDALAEKRVLIGVRKGTLLGGDGPSLVQCYLKALPAARVTVTTWTVAEMVKYATNVFLAVKLSLANEFRQVCEAVGINYRELQQLAIEDPRLGANYWDVPGWDGHRGFGGSCFVKDLNALISLAKQLAVKPTVMEAAWAALSAMLVAATEVRTAMGTAQWQMDRLVELLGKEG